LLLVPVVAESEPQAGEAGEEAMDQFKVATPAGSFVVALIAIADAPDCVVWAPVGEVMLTVIGLTVMLRVAVLVESVAEVTVTVGVQVAAIEVGAV